MVTPAVDFDRLQQTCWTERETENAQLVATFIQLVMNDHDLPQVLERFGEHPYRQHALAIPDGVPGLVDYMEGITKRFPDYSYDVKHIAASGDTVIFQSHATLRERDRGNDKRGLNIIDRWRIEDRRIAEHWDAQQPLDTKMRLLTLFTGGARKNPNGIF